MYVIEENGLRICKNFKKYFTLIVIEIELCMPKTIIHRILTGNRDQSLLIPHQLIDDQKLPKHQQDEIFLKTIVIDDETECFQCDSETKCQSRLPEEVNPKKIENTTSKVNIKTTLISFYDFNRIIHKEII